MILVLKSHVAIKVSQRSTEDFTEIRREGEGSRKSPNKKTNLKSSFGGFRRSKNLNPNYSEIKIIRTNHFATLSTRFDNFAFPHSHITKLSNHPVILSKKPKDKSLKSQIPNNPKSPLTGGCDYPRSK